jgi:putative transposase
MDGRGRALDNVFIEALWRSVKYEDIYLHNHVTVQALISGLNNYLRFYNHDRYHQSLGNLTPAGLYLP